LNQENVSLSANVFTKRTLVGTISVRVDQDDPIVIPHLECGGVICGGKIQIDGTLVGRLRRSKTITIEATDTNHQKVSISLSLAGFPDAYDGPETEIKVNEMTAEDMKSLVEQREKDKPPECEE